jgi:heme/copper-type cytochrome/quinol oxidase subunit 2
MRGFAVVALLGLVAFAAPTMAADPQVTIVLKDHAFTPNEVPIPANTKVELLVQNQQPTMAEFESHSLHREKIVQPGAQISVIVGPVAPGRYEFFDDFHNATRGFLVAK